MGQKIISGNYSSLHNTNTEYSTIYGNLTWGAEGFGRLFHFAVAGTLRNFRVRLVQSNGSSATPSSGETFTFTVRKNQVDTLLEVIIDDSSADGQDLTNTVDIAANDKLSLRCVPSGGNSSTRYALRSYEFIPDTGGESIYFNNGGLWTKDGANGYATFSPDCSNPRNLNEVDVQQYIATPGTVKTLRLNLSNNPGTGAEGYRLTLRKNGASTDLKVTISGGSSAGTDLSNEVSVVAGDLVNWFIEKLNNPSNSLSASFGFVFVADNTDESLFLNGYPIALNTGATAYHPFSNEIEGWNTNEHKVRQLAQAMIVRSLYVKVSAAPGAGKSWVFTVMKNNVATALTVTISDTNTTGSDLTNEVSFVDDDYISMEAVPSGTPAAANARWGAVQASFLSTAPTVTTQANTNTIAEKSTGHGTITSFGGAAVTQHGHCWSTSLDPTTSDSKTENGAAPNLGQFTSEITGLTPGTIYYVRAYATNSEGTAYGINAGIFSDTTIGKRNWWVADEYFYYYDGLGTKRRLLGEEVGGF